MTHYTCIVVDDEQLARALLESYIAKIPQLELVGLYKSPLEAMPMLQSGNVDLMFLDIQMPDLTGVELLKSLSDLPLTIFTTAYAEYALEGYSLGVVDYLLKPFSFGRFLQAANKALQQLKLEQGNHQEVAQASPNDPIASHQTPEKDYLVVKADHKLHKLLFNDILYVEGLREYVAYYREADRIIALQSLKKLEELLPQHQFIRAHKSYIVAIEKVKSLDGNQLEMQNGKLIPIGKSYREEVLKQCFQV
ncbi:MAG: LytR/AlgR family response regulator transcription factor [Flammeovirgaceae bacterium]